MGRVVTNGGSNDAIHEQAIVEARGELCGPWQNTRLHAQTYNSDAESEWVETLLDMRP